jgi:hypothetical protein
MVLESGGSRSKVERARSMSLRTADAGPQVQARTPAPLLQAPSPQARGRDRQHEKPVLDDRKREQRREQRVSDAAAFLAYLAHLGRRWK